MMNGPFEFTEHPGEDKWFGPWYRRAVFHFGPDFDGRAEMTVRFDRIPSTRKTVKVMGLSAIYPSMLWPLTARRVQRYGLEAWPDFAHENSYRVIAHLSPGNPGTVSFSTYTYLDARGGRGPSNQPKPEKVTLGKVQVGEPVDLSIKVERSGVAQSVVYRSQTPGGSFVHREKLQCAPWLWWRHFAHSSGVTPDTPERIVFSAWK